MNCASFILNGSIFFKFIATINLMDRFVCEFSLPKFVRNCLIKWQNQNYTFISNTFFYRNEFSDTNYIRILQLLISSKFYHNSDSELFGNSNEFSRNHIYLLKPFPENWTWALVSVWVISLLWLKLCLNSLEWSPYSE